MIEIEMQVFNNSNQYLKFTDFTKLSTWSSYSLLGKSLDYSQKYCLVRIGDFLKRNKEQVLIENSILYKRPTIRMNAQGVVLRDKELGESIGTKNQFRIHEGQFLLSKIDARNGAFGVVPKELEGAIITGNFWTFDVDGEKIDPYYLMLLTGTKNFQWLCQTASVGTTNRNYLQENLFLNFEIPLPSLQQQKKIIQENYLKIETCKNLTEQANKLECGLENYLNNILGRESFAPEENKNNQYLKLIKFYELEKWGVDKNKSSNLIINKLYPVKKIKELCSVSSGGTPSRSRKDYYNGNIPWIKTGEVVNSIIYDTAEKITVAAINDSSAKVYSKGSLIIAMYGQGLTRGRTAKLGVDAATNQACAVLYDIDNDIILTDYLWIYMMGEYHRLRELASGNNQPNLNAQMIKDYGVILPPRDVQKQIVDHFNQQKKEIKNLQNHALKLKVQAEKEFEETVFNL